MKHIFKKLHIGSSNSSGGNTLTHDPIRLNDATAAPTSATSSDDHHTSLRGQPQPSSPIASPNSFSVASTNQPDYFSSEEEFQVHLALAISASNTDDPDNDQIRAATLMSLGNRRENREPTAQSLSRHYWDYNVIDYKDIVVDGFYDVYRISSDDPIQKNMPSITDLETTSGPSGFEVVIVNRKLDPSLEELIQVAHCIAIDCKAAKLSILVQRLAELVTEHMGGPVKDGSVMLARWIERSTELRTSRHTSVFPVGTLSIGLSRHRALLFKVLADSISLPCKLVKGCHYTGTEDDALNMIKLENDREYLVDLMAEPGTLIPADVASGKDFVFKAANAGIPQICTPSTPNETDSRYQCPVELPNSSRGSDHYSVAEKDKFLNQTPSYEKSESLTTIPETGRNYSNSLGSSNEQVLGTENPLYSDAQGGTDDMRNLFADLNPLLVRRPIQNVVPNKPLEVKQDGYRRQKTNAVSGCPPIPLIPKNRHALNEVPRKNQYYNGEGVFPRNGRDNNAYNLLSNVSTSSGTLEKPLPEALRSGSSCSADKYSGNSALHGITNQFDLVPTNGGGHVKIDYKVFQKGVPSVVNQHEKLDSVREDPNMYTPNQTVGSNLKLQERIIPRPIVDSTKSMDDQMLEDVGDCEIPWEHLVVYERIGLGSYGEVYHADWNGMEVAVKKFLDQDFSGAALAEFRREVRIMRGLRHPNIVHFVGAVTRPPNLSIITEFLPRGSLYRIIHRPHGYIDERQRLKMALDVAHGMNCLHTSAPTIVHRDLKSPNLLVDNNWNVKVCDFGLSRLKHNTFLSSKSTAGTPEWMAPEVLRNEPSNEKCDVYSFGVILWELATLKLPWSGMNPMQVVGAVGFQHRRLEIPKEVDPLVARIIWECWQQDPSLRPSFAQLAVALQPLQRLQIPSNSEHPNAFNLQYASVNPTP
uniref:non-specific serine/threonine protein kinase n=1 Tax=Kalanchoe fedtschenkoi TaxID=63787 RepID=A0A7N0UQS5_KALFE